MTEKAPHAFRTISEAAEALGVPQHVLRFWESKFTFLRPMKRAGGRRFYRPQDLTVLRGIQHLLRQQGYTIRGVQKLHREHGLQPILSAAEQFSRTPGDLSSLAPEPPEGPSLASALPMISDSLVESLEPLQLRAETRYALEVVLHDIEKARKKLERVMDACLGDPFLVSDSPVKTSGSAADGAPGLTNLELPLQIRG